MIAVRKIAVYLLVICVCLMACNKSDVVSTDITAAEAANLVASALSNNSVGTVSITTDVMVNAQTIFNTGLGCGSTKNYTVTHNSISGATPVYNYAFSYLYTMNCNSTNLPDNIVGSATDAGSFDGPALSYATTGNATFHIAGFSPNSTVYALNGEYIRKGTYTSKVGNKTTGTMVIDINLSNYTVTKLTKFIVSGTGNATISGSTSRNATFAYNVIINFTGDGKATLTMNNTIYLIDLLTGAVTKK